MDKPRFVLIYTVAGVLALGGVALANSGGSGDRAGNAGQSEIIKTFAQTQQIKTIDLGEPGFSQGDLIPIFADDLLTEQGGTKIGQNQGACTVVRVIDVATRKALLQCLFTLDFDGRGQIVTHGIIRYENGFPGAQVTPITGGTGRFRSVGGELVTRAPSPTEAFFTVRVDYPKKK